MSLPDQKNTWFSWLYSFQREPQVSLKSIFTTKGSLPDANGADSALPQSPVQVNVICVTSLMKAADPSPYSRWGKFCFQLRKPFFSHMGA